MLRHTLQHRVNACASTLAAHVRTPPAEEVAAVVDEGDFVVLVKVAPGALAPTLLPVQYPGAWLSSTEQLIWRTLEAGSLLGKQIAAAMGWDYSTRLKVLLSNLEERGVLTHDEAVGYARAPSRASPWAS